MVVILLLPGPGLYTGPRSIPLAAISPFHDMQPLKQALQVEVPRSLYKGVTDDV